MRRVILPALLLFASSLRAELPSPRFDRLAPLGGAAGSSVKVEVAGADIDEPATAPVVSPITIAVKAPAKK